MIEQGKIPDSFQRYKAQESQSGAFRSLTTSQKDELAGIILTTVATEIASENDLDTTSYIHKSTGISRIAISTGIIELLNTEYLRPGQKGEAAIVINLQETSATSSEV